MKRRSTLKADEWVGWCRNCQRYVLMPGGSARRCAGYHVAPDEDMFEAAYFEACGARVAYLTGLDQPALVAGYRLDGWVAVDRMLHPESWEF